MYLHYDHPIWGEGEGSRQTTVVFHSLHCTFWDMIWQEIDAIRGGVDEASY